MSKSEKITGMLTLLFLAGIITAIVLALAGGSSKPIASKNDASNTNSGSCTTDGTCTISAPNTTSATNTQPQQPSCTSYKAIDSQTWLEIVKDPDAHNGECITVYGQVTQFDSATGTSGFRADVGGVEQTPQYGFVNYPTNTALVGDASTLTNVVEQDLFTANVMVLGSYSYQTQIGGQTTVPQLQVDSIQVTGTLSN